RFLETGQPFLLLGGRLQRDLGGGRQDLPGLGQGTEAAGAGARRSPGAGTGAGTLSELGLLRIGEDLVKPAVDLLLEGLQRALLLLGQLQRVLHEGGQDLIGPRRAPGATGAARPEPALGGIQVFPEDLLVRGDLEDRAVGSRTDLGVPIGESMSTRDEEG